MENKYILKLEKFMEVISAISLLAMLIVVSIQVVFRYTAFLRVPPWTEELSRYTMIYTVAIASGIAIKRKAYLGMDSIYMLCPIRLKRVLDLIFNMLTAWIFYIIFANGIVVMESASIQSSPSLGISMLFVYISLPLTGINVLLFLVIDTYRAIKSFIRNKPIEDDRVDVNIA